MSGSGKYKKVGKTWVKISDSSNKSTSSSSSAREKRVKIDGKMFLSSEARYYINKILKKILNNDKNSKVYLENLGKLPTKPLRERVDELKTGSNNIEDFHKDFFFNSLLKNFYKQGSKKKHKKKPTKKHKKKHSNKKHKKGSTKRRSVKRIYTKRR